MKKLIDDISAVRRHATDAEMRRCLQNAIYFVSQATKRQAQIDRKKKLADEELQLQQQRIQLNSKKPK